MREIDFAITINLTLSLEGESATVSVKHVDLKPAMITLPIKVSAEHLESIEKKKTYHQIIAEVAKEFISKTGKEVFTAANLYHLARDKYPYVKRNTFNNRVMAAAPEHPSYKHLSGTRDFLSFLGEGKYSLKQ